MENKAVVALLTWDRVVPWKILCLPDNAADEFAPIGFGSDVRKFHEGDTIWVVSVPRGIPGVRATLVARVKVHHHYERTTRRDRCSKFLSDMLDQWKFVGTSNGGSGFFELNDATKALEKLGLSSSRLGFRKSVVVDPTKAASAFRGCMSSRKPTVFLSYTHAEGESVAVSLVPELFKRGFRPWLDRLTLPGFSLGRSKRVEMKRLRQLIRQGVGDSGHAVVLKTKSWGQTGWTKEERRWIRARRRDDDGFRCAQVVFSGRKLAGFDACLDAAPPAELAHRIASALRERSQP